jgi:hypothetical protein
MRALILALSLIGLAPAAHAGPPPSAADQTAIQAVINAQLGAFRHDDADGAFSYASPHIREIFQDPTNFLSMVKQGYPTVYRAQSASFGAIDTSGPEPVQKVELVGPDGQGALALYTMEREPDGSWRIDGCVLVKSERVDT